MSKPTVTILTLNAPWISRFRAYLNERFPHLNGFMFLIFFLTAYIYTSFLNEPELQVIFNWKSITGFIAVYSFFFRLRVMDEHKDYEKDSINYPTRVLQSGLVTLGHLRTIAIFGTVLEALVSWWFSEQVFFLWLLAFGYSFLMFKEFFVGRWLEQRLFLYALSHMLVMPMMVLWSGSMGAPHSNIPNGLLLLGLLSFLSGFAFELSRKIKSPEDEREGILTYSSIFGTKQAPLIALGCLIGASALLAVLLDQVKAEVGFYAAILLLLVGCTWFFVRFIRQPNPRHAKGLELASSLYMLSAYVLVISATLLITGIRWS